jgi:hypothetical protein
LVVSFYYSLDPDLSAAEIVIPWHERPASLYPL